jgi:uncharacterized protein YodC (DUF2158 family)
MADEFKPGDVVKLKSGGPLMTVVTADSKEAECEWFDEKKVPQRHTFFVTSLKPSNEETRRAQAGGKTGPWS